MWARRSVAVVGLLLIIGSLLWRSSERRAPPTSPPSASGDDVPAAAPSAGLGVETSRQIPTTDKTIAERRALTDALLAEQTIPDRTATGDVEGRVTELGVGAPVPAFRVVLRRGTEAVASGSEAADVPGRFAFFDVPVGTVTLEVRAHGFLPYELKGVDVRERATTTVPVIALDRGVVVTGRVRGPAQIPWKGRFLWFQGPDAKPDTWSAFANVRADGTFWGSGLTAGTYRVFSPPERPWEKGAVTLVPSDGAVLVVPDGAPHARFEWDFVAAGTLSIGPLDHRLPWPEPARFAGGSAAAAEARTKFGAETRVRVTGPGGKTVLDVTGVTNGSRSVGVLTLVPGRYVARIDFPGGETREEPVTVEAGAEVEVAFGKR